MDVVTRILAGVGLGALAGAIGGFVTAVFTLQARHWRNARRVARGEPAVKYASFPRAFVPMSAILSAPVAGALAPFVSLPLAATLGAAVFPTLLVALSLGFALSSR